MPGPWLRLLPWALVAAVATSFIMYTALRLRVTYQLERDVAELRSTSEELARTIVALRSEAASRLDLIERTLFGEVAAKLKEPPTPATMPVQPWQRNRDRELRDRILRLEEWRLQHTAAAERTTTP